MNRPLRPLIPVIVALLACAFVFGGTGCETLKVKNTLADSQAAMIASNDGTPGSAHTREGAIKELNNLRAKYPGDPAVQANIGFRIAMLTTVGGLTDTADEAWSEVTPYRAQLTPDQDVLYRGKTSLVWFFSKPSATEKSPEEKTLFDGEREKQESVSAAATFERIAEADNVSPGVRLWGAYQRAYIAYKHRRSYEEESSPEIRFKDARESLDKIRTETGIASLDREINSLKAKPAYLTLE
ncbi:MAG TPA: hypothetical protein VIT21_02405 [Chthoniobacterales bacterium]